MIPSSCSLQKDCRLTHGISLDYRKTFLEINFLRFISPRYYSQRIQSDDVQRNREAVSEAGRTKTIHTSEDRLNQGTIPMPTFATKPRTTSSTVPVELSQNYMIGQQREQISKLWQTAEIRSHPGFLLAPNKNYRPELQGNLMQKQCLLVLMTWKVTQRNVWKDIANLQIKRLSNYTKSQRHAWMTINLKTKKKNESVGELSTVCSQIVMKFVYLARIGRIDILCSVNKLARAVTKTDKIL